MNTGVENLLLAFFGIAALLGAAMMVVLRSPMRVAVALIATMICLGAIYGLLGVHFIAAFQVLIYVGAVMVFMVYVIMLLNVRDDRGPVWTRSLFAGFGACVLLLFVLLASVWQAAAPPAKTAAASVFGMQRFAREFLGEYWLHFELTSVLLLAAVIAALAIIRVSRRVDAAQRGKAGHG